jgi:hypothetical protein
LGSISAGGVDPNLSAGTDQPRRPGDLGEWIALPEMNTPRAQFGLAVARDPSDSSVHHIYATGGLDDRDAALGTYEFLTVTVDANGSHQVAASWADGTETFGVKYDHEAYAVNAFVAPPPIFDPTESWIFLGPGQGAGAGPGALQTTRFLSGQVQVLA